MKQWIAIAGVLALTVGLALVLAGRLKSEPKSAPHPSDNAIGSVVQTFNEETDTYWRRIGGDVATGYINLGDYHDYVKGNAGPVEKPLLATMEIRPRDTDGFLFTADILRVTTALAERLRSPSRGTHTSASISRAAARFSSESAVWLSTTARPLAGLSRCFLTVPRDTQELSAISTFVLPSATKHNGRDLRGLEPRGRLP